MTFRQLLPQTVSISTVTADVLDADRNWVRQVSATTVTRGRLEQVSTAEPTDVLTAKWRLFLPPDVTIGPADHVTIDGRRYEVDGLPFRAYGARAVHHLEVTLTYAGGIDEAATTPDDAPVGYGIDGYGLGYYGGTAA